MSVIDREKAIQCLGDAAVFEATAASFLTEIDAMMVQLKEVVDAGDEKAIGEKAHWIKGGLVYLHAGPSAEAAKRLQQAAKEGGATTLSAYEDLEREVQLLKEELAS